MPESGDVNPLDDLHIAYLARGEFEDGKASRGGILIVDARGLPLEFRCTSPIRPNPVQRITYGDSLIPYIAVELIAKPLLRGVRESFGLILVNDPSFLNLREHFEYPTVYVRRQGDDLGGAGHEVEQESGVLLDPDAGRFDPVVIETFRQHKADTQAAHPALERVGQHLDILEPFERIKRALDKVHEEKTLDRQ